MSLFEHNVDQRDLMQQARDEIKWNLGVELGRDPEGDPQAMVTVELRFASWLLDEGNGARLASLPNVRRAA